MRHRDQSVLFRTAALICGAISAAAQTAVPAAKPMDLSQTRYELHRGEHTLVSAPAETLNFLFTARSRRIERGGAPAEGLVVGTNRDGNIVLGASFRTKPGEYAVTLSASSAAGEVRQAAVTVVVDELQPVPSGSSRPPVVLLNGWEAGFTGACPISNSAADTFGNLAPYLVSDGVPIVYLFDNCLEDPFQSIEVLGNDLGDFLNSIQDVTGAQVPQIDLVAFSMGGLIARAYLAGLQPNETLLPPFPTLVHKLVLIATPNFGSFLAGNYIASIQTASQDGELIPGSALLWNLDTWNQHFDDLRGVPTVGVIGNAGVYIPSLTAGIGNNNASDGIVSTSSAALGFVNGQTVVTRIVPYCHVDPGAFVNLTFGTLGCNAVGIANVSSTSHLTGQIVRSFLAGTSSWQSIGSSTSSDPYLSQFGGMFFALVTGGGGYVSDLTQLTWGSLIMQPGGDLETIYYTDLVKGTGTFGWASASVGSGSGCTQTAPAGYSIAVRCKINTAITSVGPLLTSAAGRVVSTGAITIAGANFGSACSGCKVVATPAGATSGQALQVASWTNTTITATLPAALTGLITITVNAVPGTDSIAIVATSPTPSVLAAAPASLTFTYTAGGAAPAAQSIQITNTGGGALVWTATANASAPWLSVFPASGTAPSTLSVSVSPGSLGAGTYSGTVEISSSGASNTPLAVPVTFIVIVPSPSLAVAPTALAFSYSVGGSVPPAQTVSITNSGAGTLSWTATASVYWLTISPASGTAPGTLTVSLNPANLTAGTYSTTVQVTAAAAGSPASIAITLVVKGTLPAPSITSVANGASFQPGGASATWLTIFGANLSTVIYQWQNFDFVNGLLPTSLQGVTVSINGLPGYIYYLSPTQINVLAPDDPTTGPVQIQVTTAQQPSNSLTFQKGQFAPAFFTIGNGKYVAAESLSYTLVGSPGLIPGATTLPAQPGETISIYGTGFGPANPPLPTAQLIATPSILANAVQMTIGGVNAPVTYAGLVSPGLYQLNVTVPNLPNGDAAVVATIGGVSTPTGVSVTIQQ